MCALLAWLGLALALACKKAEWKKDWVWGRKESGAKWEKLRLSLALRMFWESFQHFPSIWLDFQGILLCSHFFYQQLPAEQQDHRHATPHHHTTPHTRQHSLLPISPSLLRFLSIAIFCNVSPLKDPSVYFCVPCWVELRWDAFR